MPLIKRYPNRKLYDTEAKQYVTLQDLAHMIQQGQDVVVIDYETGEDLTNLTLTQIILEQEKKSASGFVPRALLTGLIRAGGDTLNQVRRSLPGTKTGARGSLAEEAGHDLEEQVSRTVEQGRQMVEQANALLKLDERVEDILHLLNMPSTRDLQQLQTRIDALSQKLEEVLNMPETGQDEQSTGRTTHDQTAGPSEEEQAQEKDSAG